MVQNLCNALERTITLGLIDDAWKEHLRAMDDLKQSVQTAYYEQKDPLVIYKIEAFNLFRQMDERSAEQGYCLLPLPCCHSCTTGKCTVQRRPSGKNRLSKLRANKAEVEAAGHDYAANESDKFEPGGGGTEVP